jgi:putative transposase
MSRSIIGSAPPSISSRARPAMKCLNTHWFLSLADAREKMDVGCKDYNEERPHGAIGQKTPIMLLNHDGAASPPS